MIGKIIKLENTWGSYLVLVSDIHCEYISGIFATRPMFDNPTNELKNHGFGAFTLSEIKTIKVLKTTNTLRKLFKLEDK